MKKLATLSFLTLGIVLLSGCSLTAQHTADDSATVKQATALQEQVSDISSQMDALSNENEQFTQENQRLIQANNKLKEQDSTVNSDTKTSQNYQEYVSQELGIQIQYPEYRYVEKDKESKHAGFRILENNYSATCQSFYLFDNMKGIEQYVDTQGGQTITSDDLFLGQPAKKGMIRDENQNRQHFMVFRNPYKNIVTKVNSTNVNKETFEKIVQTIEFIQ